MVDGEEENEFGFITKSGAITELTLQSFEFQENNWGSSSTPTEIMGEIAQDFHNDVFVKEEHELTIKTETYEALSFKKESSSNDEAKRSDNCKTGTWEDIKEETRSITSDAEGNDLLDRKYEFPAATRDGENFERSNYSCELYSDSTASSDANIPKQSVRSVTKGTVNYVEVKTNNYSTSSLIQNSQELSDTDEDSLTKKEHELAIFKSREPLKTFKSCKINIDVPRPHLGELMNESSFNANELLNITTNKKPESARHNGKRKQQLADSKKKSFRCNVCEYTATWIQNLNKHMRTHTGVKPFQCDVCGLSVTHKESLIIHMRSHTGEKPFPCDVCDYRAAGKQNLNQHKRTHTGEKPFKCDVCGLSMARKASLNVHMRTHTGEKRFQCDICGYRAVEKQSLIKHTRTHTGEKPFQCSVCNYSTAYKTALTRHLSVHTARKQFKCNVCDFITAYKTDLTRHLRVHNCEKQFQ